MTREYPYSAHYCPLCNELSTFTTMRTIVQCKSCNMVYENPPRKEDFCHRPGCMNKASGSCCTMCKLSEITP